MTDSAPRPRRPLAPVASILLASAAILWLPSCGNDDAQTPGGQGAQSQGFPLSKEQGPKTEDTLQRERVVVHFSKEEFAEALQALQPLLDADDPAARDFITSAQIALRLGDLDGAMGSIERAGAIAPASPAVLYTKARIAVLNGEAEEAMALFEKVLESEPNDPATKIGLAGAILFSDESEEAIERVRTLLEEVAGLGLPNGLQWYVTAVYKRWRLAVMDDESEESRRDWATLWNSLSAQGFKAASEADLDPGDLAGIAPPKPTGSFPAAPPTLPTYGEPEFIATLETAPQESSASAFQIHDMDGNRTADVVTLDGDAVAVTFRAKDGTETRSVAIPGGVTGPFRVLDLNQRRGGDSMDVVAVAGSVLVIYEQSDDSDGPLWLQSPVALPDMGGEIRDFELVDFDHDGDLDLLAVGAFGARLLKNDGAGAAVNAEGEALPRGTWTDVSEAATLPKGAYDWCAVEDFDGDNDVDLVIGGALGAHLMDSQRRGLFTNRGAQAFGDMVFPREPALADLDGDARPDFFVPSDQSSIVLRQQADGTFAEILTGYALPAGSVPVAGDLDLDGAVDVIWNLPGGEAKAVLGIALPSAALVDLPSMEGASGPLALAEIDAPDPYGDLGLELIRLRGTDVVAQRTTGGVGAGLYLKFVGQKDNRQGVGAIVEVRARDVYRRIFWRGDAEVVGIGAQKSADVVRITWPNGVRSQELNVDAGVQFMLDGGSDFGVQPEGLIGSCPFLYTWNGQTFEFISDVIGITPLGLPMAPGMLVPPDHDEYVLVRGDQLVADANGEFVMQFTEELREVTYLDRARLDVIDHPAGTSIYPNERFKFPPFPEAHTHVVERTAQVKRATGSDGQDWTSELQERDFRHPRPFQRLAGQYLGLAEPHWLELEFDPADLEDAKLLRLVATGWFYWSDASANVAAATTPGVAFVPPVIEIPGPDGTWVPAGPPVGFPAGKTKTMIIDVSDIIPREDPRIRLGSTLELYWDCIELATCNDDAALWTHPLEPIGAELWSRGFSEPMIPEREDLPLFFEWDKVASRPRWNQHPGLYTRFGDALPLLGEIDDQFVIMGSGDALTLRFDAKALPPVPKGYVRDYLVFLDGWAKDRDPNTHEALEVEPLPFHDMSGYPYSAEESFPKTPEHETWRKEWNTRREHQWIVPLSPAREAEWLHGLLDGSR